MTDSYTLLADLTTSGPRETLLKADLDDVTAGASVLPGAEETLVVTVWLGSVGKYLCVAYDSRWFEAAAAVLPKSQDAYVSVWKELKERGYSPGGAQGAPLFADHALSGRRTSELKDGSSKWAMRAKHLRTEDDEAFVQLRLWNHARGYMHAVFRDDGVFVTSSTAGNDGDTWSRLRGELGRRDIDVN